MFRERIGFTTIHRTRSKLTCKADSRLVGKVDWFWRRNCLAMIYWIGVGKYGIRIAK